MSKRRSETPEEYDLRMDREAAEHRDARRNEVITRGELFDALEAAYRRLAPGTTAAQMLIILAEELK